MTPLFDDVDYSPLIKLLQDSQHITITTHCNPDGDGIGSQIALYDLLTRMGKTVRMVNRDGLPRIYSFLAHAIHVEAGAVTADTDLIIVVDSGSLSRLGHDASKFAGIPVVNIDHHASNKMFGDLNVVDSRYCATGAMIYDLFVAMNATLTAAAAEAIYSAVLTDTASFRLATASADVFRMAAELIEAGAKPWPISMAIYESRSMAGLKILSAALDSLEIRDQGRSAWIVIDHHSYEKSGADVEDTEGLIDYARSLDGIEIAVMIRADEQQADSWKVSFRGKTHADVGQLAASLGGGGHPYASGCLMRGSFDDVVASVQRAVTQVFA